MAVLEEVGQELATGARWCCRQWAGLPVRPWRISTIGVDSELVWSALEDLLLVRSLPVHQSKAMQPPSCRAIIWRWYDAGIVAWRSTAQQHLVSVVPGSSAAWFAKLCAEPDSYSCGRFGLLTV